MREDKFANLPVKADGAHNISLVEEYRDPRYRLKMSPVSPATRTGLISLFELVPDDQSLPGFVARWDHRAQTIDIDPEPLTCIDRETWRNEQNGYRGHHTNHLSGATGAYQIDVRTPNGPVFKAIGSLNLQLGVQLTDSFQFSDTVSAKTSPKTK